MILANKQTNPSNSKLEDAMLTALKTKVNVSEDNPNMPENGFELPNIKHQLIDATTDLTQAELNTGEVKFNTGEAIFNTSEARFNMREARFNMIEQQVRTWDVLDPVVLQLLHDLPRENFVPIAYQGLAFADIEIPLGYNQYMLSPKLEGRMLQALGLKKTQTVLHIGTGSGYFTALLASLAKHVTTIEINPDLSTHAAKNIAQNNINNVTFLINDATTFSPNNQTFDVIVYTASTPIEPANMRAKLNINGVMLLVIGNAPAMQATLISRVSTTGYKQETLFETCISELNNSPQTPHFNF